VLHRAEHHAVPGEKPVVELLGNALGRSRGGEHREGFFVHLEVNGAITGQFTVQLHRNILLAAHAKLASLKIFNFRNPDVGTEDNVMKIFNDLEKTEPLEHNDVE
jgi:hypothetical protein